MESEVWGYEGCGLIFELQEVQVSEMRLYTLVKIQKELRLMSRTEL